ncbi:unnamed protein product [Dicrocoelium dendriticum]|nr:unnamed protein product [Dicrocoelium dendriticum]
MGSIWVKNLLHLQLTDEELANIPHPKAELLLHVWMRTIQATSFLGGFIVAPIATLVKQPASLRSLHSRFIRYSVFGLLPGFVLGPALYYGRMRNQPEVAYFDRAYRLRRNKGQVHVDLLSLTGAVAGGCLSPWTPYRPVEAAVVGMFFGLTIAIIGPRILDK